MIRRRVFAIGMVASLMLAAPCAAPAEPRETPIVGPKSICFKYSTFSLLEGERITDVSGGTESTRVVIEGPRGAYSVMESEILADPKGHRRMVSQQDQTTVYRISGFTRRYVIFGATAFSHGKDVPVILLEGKGLHDTKTDAAIYDRFTVRDPKGTKCQWTFTYFWGLD